MIGEESGGELVDDMVELIQPVQGTVGQKAIVEELGILSIKTPHIWYRWNPLVTLRSFLMILKNMASRGSCRIRQKATNSYFQSFY